MKIEMRTSPPGFSKDCLWEFSQQGNIYQFFVDYTKWAISKIVRKTFGICK